MSVKFDVNKLSDSELRQIQEVAQGMTHQKAELIRSTAIADYVNKAVDYRNASQFSTHCYVIAVVNYLNNQGFEIIKKEQK